MRVLLFFQCSGAKPEGQDGAVGVGTQTPRNHYSRVTKNHNREEDWILNRHFNWTMKQLSRNPLFLEVKKRTQDYPPQVNWTTMKRTKRKTLKHEKTPASLFGRNSLVPQPCTTSSCDFPTRLSGTTARCHFPIWGDSKKVVP